MDVDASERRAGRGGRGSHETRRRWQQNPAVKKLPELHLVRASEAAAPSNVIHISGIRSHGPADLYAVASWPLKHAWRDLVLSLMKKPTP